MSTATFGYAPVVNMRPAAQARSAQVRSAQVRSAQSAVAQSRGTEAPAMRSHLRLTPRGRAVFTALAAFPLVIAAFFVVINGGSATATFEGAPVGSYEFVTVESGQSLWALAVELAPSSDPRDVIADIQHFNGLSSAQIVPGQRLAIPSQYVTD